MRSLVSRSLLVAALVSGAGYSPGIGTALAQARETPKEIIAAHIRRQGFACDKPVSAERNRKLSKADEPVWVLKCENVVYQVRLIPDMAAHVRRIK